MILAAFALIARADAAACMCARGSSGLPSGEPMRTWAGSVGLDYAIRLEADPSTWRGFGLVDRYGDSMAGMYMPPMLVQTGALTATLGLPAHFSASATLPYTYKDNLGASAMPGDTDLASFDDADLTAKWTHPSKDKKTFYGASAGLTFPTGTVLPNSPVRSGRGVFGTTVAAHLGGKLNPKVTLAAQVSGSTGFGPDATGYTVAPTASLIAGLKWWPRENGKLNLSFFGLERWSGNDRKDALVYKNSGYLVTDLAVAGSYTFWAEELRSASFDVKLQAPVFEVVGDPMYAENFGASAGLSVVAF